MWTSTRPIVFGEESVPWSACIASATGAAATVASRVPRSHGRERRFFEVRQAPLADAPKLVASVGGLSSVRALAAIASLPVTVAPTRPDAEGDGCGSKGGGDGGGGDGGGGLGDGGGGEGDGGGGGGDAWFAQTSHPEYRKEPSDDHVKALPSSTPMGPLVPL